MSAAPPVAPDNILDFLRAQFDRVHQQLRPDRADQILDEHTTRLGSAGWSSGCTTTDDRSLTLTRVAELTE
jgi:hypothetical protein